MRAFKSTQGYHTMFHNLLMASRFCPHIVHFSARKIQQPFQQFLIQLVPNAVHDLMRLTATRTLSNVSKCHRLLGAKRSADKTMFDEHWALNSGSVFSRNSSNSFIIVRMLLELTSAKLSSRALRLMDTSGSWIQQINATIQQLCPYIIYTDIISLKFIPLKFSLILSSISMITAPLRIISLIMTFLIFVQKFILSSQKPKWQLHSTSAAQSIKISYDNFSRTAQLIWNTKKLHVSLKINKSIMKVPA